MGGGREERGWAAAGQLHKLAWNEAPAMACPAVTCLGARSTGLGLSLPLGTIHIAGTCPISEILEEIPDFFLQGQSMKRILPLETGLQGEGKGLTGGIRLWHGCLAPTSFVISEERAAGHRLSAGLL